MAAANSVVQLPPPRPDHSWVRPPKSKFTKFFWRQKMWFDSTFVFSFLEPWEYLLLLSIFTIIFFLLVVGAIRYLPPHIAIMQRRAAYYLWGQLGDERLASTWFSSSYDSSLAGSSSTDFKELL